jgi:cysteine desulfurase
MRAYLDANATYPVAPEHYDRVCALLKTCDGNPSSIHEAGRSAKVALEKSRSAVARLLGATGSDLVFTSGATEANNLAIQGVVHQAQKSRKAGAAALPHVIIFSTEHSSVREPCKVLEAAGEIRLDVAPVRPSGEADLDALLQLLTPETALVCVMAANNEIGVINDVRSVVAAVKAKARCAHVHVDAVQGLGKLDLTWIASSPIDSAAISAHKVGGLKGIGALYLKAATKLCPLTYGGGQERARRPGTENIPGIVSFGMIADDLKEETAMRVAAMARLKDHCLKVLGEIPGAHVHGDPTRSLPNTVNFHVDGVPGEDLLLNMDLSGVQCSSGSACSSGVARPSPVLLALGLGEWIALNSIRVSFSHLTKLEDIDALARVVRDVTARARKLA